MCSLTGSTRFLLAGLVLLALSGLAFAQRTDPNGVGDSEFGPVMRAYLGYLSNEQDVVDDRASRREITAAYYRRNSNRIHALRQMAVRLARENGNDYVPELEAVASDEFGTLFEKAPKATSLRQHEILANKFRFLGVVHAGEPFYLFARLDPYEQAELIQRQGKEASTAAATGGSAGATAKARPPSPTSRATCGCFPPMTRCRPWIPGKQASTSRTRPKPTRRIQAKRSSSRSASRGVPAPADGFRRDPFVQGHSCR